MMDTQLSLLNIPHGVDLSPLLNLFDSVNFTDVDYTVLRSNANSVVDLRRLYTSDDSGLVLKLWGTSCRYNAYGHFTVIKLSQDNRRHPDFMVRMRQLPNYYMHEHTGSLLYTTDGFMGWHTNHDETKPDNTLDLRVYITHNTTVGSVFKYINAENQVISLYEPLGRSVKVFDVTNPFWHCVEAKGNRISLGTRVLLFR